MVSEFRPQPAEFARLRAPGADPGRDAALNEQLLTAPTGGAGAAGCTRFEKMRGLVLIDC
jgi:hypothetical protein